MAKKSPPTPRRSTSRKRVAPGPPDRATAYATAVVGGTVVANYLIRLACERHLRDLEQGAARGLRWDRETAERHIQFFPDVLRLAEGEHQGRPFTLEPFQAFIVGSLFGWKRRNGFRRFRTAYIEIAKGSGKTPLAAGIGLELLTIDGEASAEVYSAAVTKDQAKLCFRDAERMVEASPELARRIEITVNNLAHLASGSFFRPVSSEHRGLDGKRVHGAIIDELHEHPTSIVVDKMRAGTKGRRQALIVEITNSGYDRHSVCYQHHEYSEKILQGVIDNDEWFAFVCGLDPCAACRDEGRTQPKDGCEACDDWRDPRVWPKANPNLGVSIQPSYLEEQVREAIGMPAKQNMVKRLNMCIWTEQADKWVDVALWDEGAGDPLDLAALAGRSCYAGLDLSSTTDLTALVLLFPPPADGEPYVVVPHFFVPAENVALRARKDRVPYDVWLRDEHLTATEGNVVDYRAIRHRVHEVAEAYDLRELVFDRWNSSQLITELMDDGITCVPLGQGFASYAAPAREFEMLVQSRRIRHGGHPVLRWCVSNVAAATDPAGNRKPDKSKSTERIDGVTGLLMALARAILAPDDAGAFAVGLI